MTLAPPPAPEGASTSAEEQAPRDDDEESPATSRSSELAGRTRSARERLEAVLDRIEEILSELDIDEEITATAKLEAHRSLVSAIRLLAQFTGEVGASETTVAASPFYRRVRTAIVDALRPEEHRAALDAIIAALEHVETGGQQDRAEAAE